MCMSWCDKNANAFFSSPLSFISSLFAVCHCNHYNLMQSILFTLKWDKSASVSVLMNSVLFIAITLADFFIVCFRIQSTRCSVLFTCIQCNHNGSTVDTIRKEVEYLLPQTHSSPCQLWFATEWFIFGNYTSSGIVLFHSVTLIAHSLIHIT